MTYRLLDRDYEEIDRQLLGSSSLNDGDLLSPDDSIAPAQGNPFLAMTSTLTKLLSKFDVRYRD